MDQELLAIMMKSLKSVKDVALIDQAFLQVGFLRRNGYDIIPVSEMNMLRSQHQKLEKNITSLLNATNRLLDMEARYQLLFEKQSLKIGELEEEIKLLKLGEI